MYYRVIPFSKSFDTFGLIYKSDQQLVSGTLVKIPLRNTKEIGIIFGKADTSQIDFDINNIQKIDSLISEIVFLDTNTLSLIDYISHHYITPVHHALNLFFPKNLLEKTLKNKLNTIKNQDYNYKNTSEITLSLKQQEVFDSIEAGKKYLLYGITGSGKTEIYIKIIQENLKLGKQSILLIPEIILTSQIGERLKDFFGDQVLLLHSGISAAKKSGYWMDIYNGNAKIIVGTRSTLFYPFQNLGTIIIDEEHDPSYISDIAPRYHTLDIAEYITSKTGCSLILGSGTPRTTTMYRSIKGDFQILQLLEKYT